MSQEGQLLDKKSLRAVTGRSTDWDGLTKDCVAFANAQGGRLLIGIEDDAVVPDPGQRIESPLVDLVRRKIGERTVNVSVLSEILKCTELHRLVVLMLENVGRYPHAQLRRAIERLVKNTDRAGRNGACYTVPV